MKALLLKDIHGKAQKKVCDNNNKIIMYFSSKIAGTKAIFRLRTFILQWNPWRCTNNFLINCLLSSKSVFVWSSFLSFSWWDLYSNEVKEIISFIMTTNNMKEFDISIAYVIYILWLNYFHITGWFCLFIDINSTHMQPWVSKGYSYSFLLCFVISVLST